ncbi:MULTISPECIES: urea ABC transporter substrate-binding protein [unclassified Brenneria]|uniref:urea ABC transporter substrate-binding protein n=1 Tax=unclassified Brenneria TaxID=2634434 RepID=UPI00155674BE|nr:MULTISPECIES: ABC transporter substrate-binding protein [unclassified Brenneria]MBJ7221262.1 transporter substrate-binding protein [Brenneria sp. L3-3C-1]MEE3642506.1 ABC transporter substrate-binding protein [Brenneria sp. L3_3C_1]MEE3650122.1 ABC transporter substrate-binding protein [Brenneria sp. HEZEL_4_2_4]NPD00081.1 transporter substrate-binding protein [Brenneria sp. hezel4-2-4]
MAISRRSFITHSMLSALGLATVGIPKFPLAAEGGEPIKVATIFDLSGGLDIYGKPMANAMNLAAEEINASGGLLGRPLQMINYDAQSSMQLYAQYAQQAALKDKVAVVHAGITSASREVIRPVLSRFRTLYFYPALYEGGVCDRNYFSSGSTPAQTVEKMVPYAMNKWGKKVYILAADYNFGQIISQWVKKYVRDHGGESVAVDFFPLDVTDFGAAISKVQSAKPDFIWSALVGGAHLSFYRQWHAAGMTGKIPIASTNFGSGNEHIILSPAESNGILVCSNYLQESAEPANEEFIKRFKAKYGANAPYISDLAMGAYQGMLLWAEGVRKAGDIDRMKVIEALETGITVNSPSGKVTIDPATHHCTLDVHIAEVQDHRMKILESFSQQRPLDTAMVCDLKKNPRDTKQYQIQL